MFLWAYAYNKLFKQGIKNYICASLEGLIKLFMKKINVIVLFTFISFCCIAQAGKSDYYDKFTQGNYLLLEQNYTLALKYFLDAYQIDSTNANINYKLGVCYLQSAAQKNNALPYLEKATLNISHNYNDMEPREKKAPENTYYLIGLAYRLAYKFNESNTYFNKFKDIIGTRNKELVKDLENQINWQGSEDWKKP